MEIRIEIYFYSIPAKKKLFKSKKKSLTYFNDIPKYFLMLLMPSLDYCNLFIEYRAKKSIISIYR